MTKKDEATPVTVAEKQGNDQGKDQENIFCSF